MSKSTNVIVAAGVLKAITELVPLLEEATWGLHYDEGIAIEELERPVERLVDDLDKLKLAVVELDKLQ